jgi:hypothetical protein
MHDDPPAETELERALRAAPPLPADLPGVWDELMSLRRTIVARLDIDPGHTVPTHIENRLAELEHLLDTLPADGWRAVHTRTRWLEHILGQELPREGFTDRDVARRLRMDVEALYASTRAKVATASPMTASAKRQAAASILDTSPELSDREIARRTGTSPSTVAAVRRQRQRDRPSTSA